MEGLYGVPANMLLLEASTTLEQKRGSGHAVHALPVMTRVHRSVAVGWGVEAGGLVAAVDAHQLWPHGVHRVPAGNVQML